MKIALSVTFKLAKQIENCLGPGRWLQPSSGRTPASFGLPVQDDKGTFRTVMTWDEKNQAPHPPQGRSPTLRTSNCVYQHQEASPERMVVGMTWCDSYSSLVISMPFLMQLVQHGTAGSGGNTNLLHQLGLHIPNYHQLINVRFMRATT